MSTSKAVVMFIEIHHLETIKLLRNLFDLLLFSWLDHLHALCIPARISIHLKIVVFRSLTI
jgi:hypothetical protein